MVVGGTVIGMDFDITLDPTYAQPIVQRDRSRQPDRHFVGGYL